MTHRSSMLSRLRRRKLTRLEVVMMSACAVAASLAGALRGLG